MTSRLNVKPEHREGTQRGFPLYADPIFIFYGCIPVYAILSWLFSEVFLLKSQILYILPLSVPVGILLFSTAGWISPSSKCYMSKHSGEDDSNYYYDKARNEIWYSPWFSRFNK